MKTRVIALGAAAMLIACGCADTIPIEPNEVVVYTQADETVAVADAEETSPDTVTTEGSEAAEVTEAETEQEEMTLDIASLIAEESRQAAIDKAQSEAESRGRAMYESYMESQSIAASISNAEREASIAESISVEESMRAESISVEESIRAERESREQEEANYIAAQLAAVTSVDKAYWAPYIDPKTVFVTFDDGPSPYTAQVLDTLDAYGVKATFFVTYKPAYEQTYRDIVNRGHTIGIHTAFHRYDEIYSSFDVWYADFKQIYDYVVTVTGVTPKYYRFPGGSNNTYLKNNPAVKLQIIQYLDSIGMEYFDWNVVTGDGGNVNAAQEIEKSATVLNRHHPVLLAHDTKAATAEALPYILANYASWGYSFARITDTTAPIHQGSAWDY